MGVAQRDAVVAAAAAAAGAAAALALQLVWTASKLAPESVANDAFSQEEAVEPPTPVSSAIRQLQPQMAAPAVRSPFRRVACVGTGVIGASWAALYAAKGLDVAMFSRNAAKLQGDVARARRHIHEMEASGLVPNGTASAACARLRVATSLEDAVADAELVHETIAEDETVKRNFFVAVGQAAPPTSIIASSTSGLVISKVIEGLDEQLTSRVIVAHPFNPPHIVKLVELVPMPGMSPETVATVDTFFRACDRSPVLLNKEVPGHIGNRLQAAIWREAISLVARGVATVADVDTALHEGPGVRWALLGQHAIFDLGGGPAGYRGFFDGIGRAAFEPIWADMDQWGAPPSAAKELCIAGVADQLEKRGYSRAELAAWRNSTLAELVKMKQLVKLKIKRKMQQEPLLPGSPGRI